jgi:hypothetical protein
MAAGRGRSLLATQARATLFYVKSDTQNVTVSVPREILRRVKLLAVERHSSVSRLLVQQLAALVNQTDEYERAHNRYRARMRRLPDLGTRGKAGWSRDDLHER